MKTLMLKEVMVRLKTTPPTIQKLVKAGHLTIVSNGRVPTYRRDEVEALSAAAVASDRTLRQMIMFLVRHPAPKPEGHPAEAPMRPTVDLAVMQRRVDYLVTLVERICHDFGIPLVAIDAGREDTHAAH